MATAVVGKFQILILHTTLLRIMWNRYNCCLKPMTLETPSEWQYFKYHGREDVQASMKNALIRYSKQKVIR